MREISTQAVLELEDQDGISIRDAMVDFGLKPNEMISLDLRNTQVIGYIETHIEQGPVLDDENLPLGIVTAIAGIERHQITLKGSAAHAGTTPMYGRKDTLACAAELVLATERIAGETPELIATIGKMNVSPNAVNVVPGEASMILEVRSAVNETREHGGKAIISRMKEIAAGRSISFASAARHIDNLQYLATENLKCPFERSRFFPALSPHRVLPAPPMTPLPWQIFALWQCCSCDAIRDKPYTGRICRRSGYAGSSR